MESDFPQSFIFNENSAFCVEWGQFFPLKAYFSPFEHTRTVGPYCTGLIEIPHVKHSVGAAKLTLFLCFPPSSSYSLLSETGKLGFVVNVQTMTVSGINKLSWESVFFTSSPVTFLMKGSFFSQKWFLLFCMNQNYSRG